LTNQCVENIFPNTAQRGCALSFKIIHIFIISSNILNLPRHANGHLFRLVLHLHDLLPLPCPYILLSSTASRAKMGRIVFQWLPTASGSLGRNPGFFVSFLAFLHFRSPHPHDLKASTAFEEKATDSWNICYGIAVSDV
jgi:hypothetical protein